MKLSREFKKIGFKFRKVILDLDFLYYQIPMFTSHANRNFSQQKLMKRNESSHNIKPIILSYLPKLSNTQFLDFGHISLICLISNDKNIRKCKEVQEKLLADPTEF